MKVVKFVVTFSILTNCAYAQSNSHGWTLNLGVSSGYGYPSQLYDENSGIPTLNFHADYSFSPRWSAGPYFAYTYSFYKFDHPDVGYKDVWKGVDVGLRTSFHFADLLRLSSPIDLRLTGFAGYTNRKLQYDEANIYRDELNKKIDAISAGAIASGAYRITKSLGLYLEAGYSREFFAGGGLSYFFR